MTRHVTARERVSRSPNGRDGKPVWLALSADERDELERLAKREARTLSATARLLMLRGMEASRGGADTATR